ncbi:cellulose synthase-like protein D1 [Macadamia integrifolia]|uniref:cellulose synthase-like protein D1 n=1 Tax=Macadamia integrifolia TaxID=60698 RepID=UPI001C4F8A42|nr:cellulose synthase-like protein D1 [Macadamia integrifolia]
MASSSSPTKSSSSSRPPTAVKFARRTSSGRVVSLSRDEDLDIPGEFSGSGDYIDYTVLMPPTPDNQPMGAGSAAGPSSSGPGSRVGITRRAGEGSSGGGGSSSGVEAKMDRRMSVMKSTKSMLLRSQTGDFDHNRWLFETKGTYGIGNVVWTDPDDYGGPDGGVKATDFIDKPWKPLTRKIRVPSAILSPYRLLVVLRLIALGLFVQWRVRNPNSDALWLWGMSIACEIWFAFSWILDQLPKLNPINRSTDLAALRDKFETPSAGNPHGRSDLPGVDIFVSTADPEKEPPLVTANTMLSILAVDYPVDKISAYISDDGAAILTFEAMAEAVNFAHLWVPFCRKHNIEPRNPDSYFSIKRDPTKNKKRPDFVKDRRWIKREYDEFKVRVNGLPDLIKKRCDMYNKREERKERQLARESSDAGSLPADGVKVQKSTWMADGTHWPGTWYNPSPDHSKGDHAGIIQVWCYHIFLKFGLDPQVLNLVPINHLKTQL